MLRTLPDGTTLAKLSNGLRVIVSPRPKTEATAVALAVGVGSKHETARTNGLVHLIEHLLFEGTEHYPNPSDLNRAVANVGGDFNAVTNVESTVFTFQAPDTGLLEALCIIADVVSRPLLNETDLKRERQVVIEEVGEKADDPYDAMEDAFAELLFPSHGLGLTITGTPSGLAKFDARDLRGLHARAYRPNNMVLAIATDRPIRKVLDAAHLVFGGLRGRATLAPLASPPPPKARLLLKNLDGRQAYATVGGRGPAWSHRDRAPLEIAMAALGGSMHSRLPMLLREALGEVYSIQSGLECYVEAGMFRTITDCRPGHLEPVLRQIIEGYLHLRTHPLTQDEIDLARHVLVGGSTVTLDQLGPRAEFFAGNLLLHHLFVTPAAYEARWRSVRRADVERVVADWVRPRQLAITCLGRLTRSRIQSLLPL